MSDIFDEVDDILNEIETETASAADTAEKSFNESELQDIMAEIESLESECEVGSLTAKKDKVDLQAEIEQELETSMESSEESKVIPLIKKSETVSIPASTSTSSEISFEAYGQMNLSLGFKIGEENAALRIDPVRGLVVTMAGVELCINQEEGCKVTMESGVKFTIPLNTTESATKKKIA